MIEDPPFIQALTRPAAYPHAAPDVVLHETHISWVFLAGDYAYKLRKPVDLGFVHFLTRAARAADCEAEVRLNRRLCPDLYLGVVDVVERDGAYTFGGPGTPVEPAVHMRRLPAEGMLPELLESGAVDARLMRRIAHRLASFHAEAATGPGVDEHGAPDAIRANWVENFTQLEPFIGQAVSAEVNEAIRTYVERFLREQAPLLERRVAEQRIRDGHGDLHASSICVDQRRLYLFDCIEFAARYRCADVAAEVAFLAMDLAHRGRADLAATFVHAYVKASGDSELLELLDFYRCYRAYVRGKVNALRLAQADLPDDERDAVLAEARAYFDLAWACAGGLGSRTLIATMGLPASGKTTLAEGLARHLGLPHVSSDVVRKELAGLGPRKDARAEFGADLYSPSMTRRTYAALRRRAERTLGQGGSVVVDATFGKASERAALRQLAERSGARLVVLVCRADESAITERLAAREHGPPKSASDARLDVWPALRAAFDEPDELPEAQPIDTSRSPAAALEQALALLR